MLRSIYLRAIENPQALLGVTTLGGALEDPALYTRPNGVAEAKALGAQLGDTKRELDAALERWRVQRRGVLTVDCVNDRRRVGVAIAAVNVRGS